MKQILLLVFILFSSLSYSQVENMAAEYKVIVEYSGKPIHFNLEKKIATIGDEQHLIAHDTFELYYFVRKNGDVVAWPVGDEAWDRMIRRCNKEGRILVHVGGQSLPGNPKHIRTICVLRKAVY